MRKILLAALCVITTIGLYAQQPDDPTQWATETADTNPPIRLGYCNTPFNTYYTKYFYEQTDQSHNYGACIFLSPEVLNKYVGDEITEVHFAVYDAASPMFIQCFVTDELITDGSVLHTLTESDVLKHGKIQTGWNAAKLKKRIKIQQNKGLYVGWLAAVDEEHAMMGDITLDNTKGQFVEDGNWFMDGQGRWTSLKSNIGLNLMIRAYAEGDAYPSNDVSVRNLDGADVIWQNKPTDYSFLVTNYGLDRVTSLDVEVMADDEVFDTKTISGLTIDHNTSYQVQIKDVAFPIEGNHTLKARVLKVNEADDTDASDNGMDKVVFAVREGAEPVERKMLLEEMTSEADPQAPLADYEYAKAVGERDDVIWVKHHIDYGLIRKDGVTPYDQFSSEEDQSYIRFYMNYPDDGCDFTPAVGLDRNLFSGMREGAGILYFINNRDELAGLLDIAKAMPSYITVTPMLTYDEATRKLGIAVEANAEIKEMMFQNRLRMTVYVVEDGLRSDIQRTDVNSEDYLNPDGSYTQNGVIRQFVNGAFGEDVEIVNYNIHRDYEVTLDESWNPANIRVVAFVHNYDRNAQDGNNVVYNAGQAKLAPLTGVHTVAADAVEPYAYYADEGMQVRGGTIAAVYDMAGHRMPTQHLTPGVYVVKTQDTNGLIYTAKVVVK